MTLQLRKKHPITALITQVTTGLSRRRWRSIETRDRVRPKRNCFKLLASSRAAAKLVVLNCDQLSRRHGALRTTTPVVSLRTGVIGLCLVGLGWFSNVGDSQQPAPPLPIKVSPTVGQWTPNRVLPNSSRHLNWGKPRRVKMAEIHRNSPSYLKPVADSNPSLTSTKPDGTTPSRLTADGQVRRATYIDLRRGPSVTLDEVPAAIDLKTPPLISRNRIHRADPIRVLDPPNVRPPHPRNDSAGGAPVTVQAAYQTGDSNSVDDVFDDVLNQLVPSDDEAPVDDLAPGDLDSAPDLETGGLDADPESARPSNDPFGDTTLPPSDDGPAFADPPSEVDPLDVFNDSPTPDLESPAQDAPDDVFSDPFDSMPAEPESPELAVPDSQSGDAEVDDPQETPNDLFRDAFPPPSDPSPSDRSGTDIESDEPLPLPDLDDLGPARPGSARDEADGTRDRDEESEPGKGDDEAPTAFNGRDCPAEMKGLRDAWMELRRQPVREIDLDITPLIEPNKSRQEEQEAKQENLALAPARQWRDRAGAVLAHGSLVDFKNSKVVVRDAGGQLRNLSWYELSNDDLCFVSAWWELPSEFNPEAGVYAVRNWTMTTFTWKASGLCHKPLYFEEVQLERYGHSAGPVKQTILSGVHFFGNIVFLPYQIGLNPPNECQYALGYYRPGSCAPWLLPAIPLDARAARMQVGALTSGLTLIP